MLNDVTKIFTAMTDESLIIAIQEMREDDPKGIIRKDGIVRQTCNKVHDIVGGNVYEYMMMVQISILKEAAYRFTPTMDELTHNV